MVNNTVTKEKTSGRLVLACSICIALSLFYITIGAVGSVKTVNAVLEKGDQISIMFWMSVVSFSAVLIGILVGCIGLLRRLVLLGENIER
jgi:hypothetical protein